MCPVGLPLIILVECQFVACDKNEMRVNARADGMRKGIAIVVPLIEACFIFLPACNKHILIFHHILLLMTINIHPTLFLFISPVQFLQPIPGCPLSNHWLANPNPCQACLHLSACHNFHNISCLEIPTLCTFQKLELKAL